MNLLHFAAERDVPSIAVWLLEKGLDVNSRDLDNRTALHHCAINGTEVCACFLISNGADLNSKDINGNTPLHLSIKNSSREETIDVFKKLLLKGAERQIQNDKGETPLDILKQKLSKVD